MIAFRKIVVKTNTRKNFRLGSYRKEATIYKDDWIIRLSDHEMTFRFRLFQKSFSKSKCIKFICVIFTELSHFIFLRVSVFIRNSSEKSTTWIHNFPNIYCAYIPLNVYLVLLTDNSWIWFRVLTKSNQTFGRHNGGRLGSIQNLKSLWSKTKKKKLIIGYHLPLFFLPCLNAKVIVSLPKQPAHRKIIPGFFRVINCIHKLGRRINFKWTGSNDVRIEISMQR